MSETPKFPDQPEDSNVLPFERGKQPIPKLDFTDPPMGDWLSLMECGTEFKCRRKNDPTGSTPKWLVNEFTHMGKLKGDVLLAPTVTLNDPRTWVWVEPISFCREWEDRGVITLPGEAPNG